MNKQNIIDYVSTIVNFCVADGNTYLYAKCSLTFEQDARKVAIGGGNFTILLSTLASLEFLATIEFILSSSVSEFYTVDEIDEIKADMQEKFAENTLLKKLFHLPKEGDLKNGTGKVLRLFLEKTSTLTGINKEYAGKLQAIRNKLAHEFTPKTIAAAAIPPIPGADFVNIILKYQLLPVFTLTSQNAIGIDSNALNHKLKPLLQYIIEKIDALKETDGEIIRINKYIQNTK